MFGEDSHKYIGYYDFYYMKWLMGHFFSKPFSSMKRILPSFDIQSWKSLIRMSSIFSLGIVSYIYKNIKKENHVIPKSVLTLFLILILPFLLVIPIIDVDSNSFFFFLFFLIIITKYYDTLSPKKEIMKYLFLLIIGFVLTVNDIFFSRVDTEILFHILKIHYVIIFFIMTFLFYILFLKKFRIIYFSIFIILTVLTFRFYSTDKLQPIKLKTALKHIYQKTGWSDEQAIQRIFQVGFSSKLDFSFYYKLAMEELGHIKSKNDKTSKKGYFIIYDREKIYYNYVKKIGKHYLLNFDFPDEVKQEIESGKINIQEPALIAKQVFVIPYILKKYSMFPMWVLII